MVVSVFEYGHWVLDILVFDLLVVEVYDHCSTVILVYDLVVFLVFNENFTWMVKEIVEQWLSIFVVEYRYCLSYFTTDVSSK